MNDFMNSSDHSLGAQLLLTELAKQKAR